MSEFREGQTATNPQTGQTAVYRNGVWEITSGPTQIPARTGTPRRLSSSDADFLRDQRDAANFARSNARAADEFMSFNRSTPTGGILRAIPGATGIESTWNSSIGSMDAITNRIAPQMRPPGSGASSNYDVQTYRRSIPNPDFPGPVNQQLAINLRFNANRQSAYIDFLERWAEQNGNLMGAQAAWEASQRPPQGEQLPSIPLSERKTARAIVTERTAPTRRGEQFDVTPQARDAYSRLPGAGFDPEAPAGSIRRPFYLGNLPETSLRVGDYGVTPDGRLVQGIAPQPVQMPRQGAQRPAGGQQPRAGQAVPASDLPF